MKSTPKAGGLSRLRWFSDWFGQFKRFIKNELNWFRFYVWYESLRLTPKAVLTLCALVCVLVHGCEQECYIFPITHLWYQLYSKSQRERTMTSDGNNCLSAPDKEGWSVTVTFSSMTMTNLLAEYKWMIACQRLLLCVFLAKTWHVVLVCSWSGFVPSLQFKFHVYINNYMQKHCVT